MIAEFGALHPRILSALDVDGPIYGFERWLDGVPEQRRKSKARPGYEASSLMPLSRDFAFVVPVDQVAGDLVKAVIGADKALSSGCLLSTSDAADDPTRQRARCATLVQKHNK